MFFHVSFVLFLSNIEDPPRTPPSRTFGGLGERGCVWRWFLFLPLLLYTSIAFIWHQNHVSKLKTEKVRKLGEFPPLMGAGGGEGGLRLGYHPDCVYWCPKLPESVKKSIYVWFVTHFIFLLYGSPSTIWTEERFLDWTIRNRRNNSANE
jgi:hypothetical protein